MSRTLAVLSKIGALTKTRCSGMGNLIERHMSRRSNSNTNLPPPRKVQEAINTKTQGLHADLFESKEVQQPPEQPKTDRHKTNKLDDVPR